jgi:hypothetical protein
VGGKVILSPVAVEAKLLGVPLSRLSEAGRAKALEYAVAYAAKEIFSWILERECAKRGL